MPHATAQNDLRSTAKARNREIESNTKWNPKYAHAGFWDQDLRFYGSNGKPRPRRHPHTHRYTQLSRHCDEKNVKKCQARSKLPKLGEEIHSGGRPTDLSASDVYTQMNCETPGFSDSFVPQTPDDMMSASTAMAIEEGAVGMGLLSTAVDQALERFEDKQTTELVRNEYDCVGADEEAGFSSSSGSSGHDTFDEDDGFELV